MAIKNIIFDMDGVLHVGKTPVPGAIEAVAKVREKGMKVFFLTNNGEHTREFFVERLRNFGFEAHVDELYTSAYGVAVYVKENLPGKRVFVFSEGMRKELEKNGVEVDMGNKAEVVVASLDMKLTYEKLVAAFQAIIGGAVFLASNEDASYPVEEGLKPGAGAIVAALEQSTGRKPVVIGKPQPLILDMIIKKYGLEKDETLMVGDRLETDILMAKQEGLKSCFVLSGVSRKEEMEKIGLEPDFVLDSIAELPGILEG